MAVTVLIVDDSAFFRKRLSEILQSVAQIKVVGTATNGKEAIEQAKKLKPDVITMDYEMPIMDGITAIKHIMVESPCAILMFSSLTHEGARVTLDALDAGAVDFLPKNFEDIARDATKMQTVLRERILSVAASRSTSKLVRRSTPSHPIDAVTPRAADFADRPKVQLRSNAARAEKEKLAATKPTSINSLSEPSHAVEIVAIGTSTEIGRAHV